MITLLIITLAILTVAVTAQQMGKAHTFISYDQLTPEESSVELITGPASTDGYFQFADCFAKRAFDEGLLDGPNKVVIFKFFTY